MSQRCAPTCNRIKGPDKGQGLGEWAADAAQRRHPGVVHVVMPRLSGRTAGRLHVLTVTLLLLVVAVWGQDEELWCGKPYSPYPDVPPTAAGQGHVAAHGAKPVGRIDKVREKALRVVPGRRPYTDEATGLLWAPLRALNLPGVAATLRWCATDSAAARLE